MRKTILYSSAIFAISALLISTGIFAVDAKTFDREETEVTKGLGVTIFSPDFLLQIVSVDKDTVWLNYAVDHSEGPSSFGVCEASSDILGNSGMGKTTVEFHTDDLDCGPQSGPLGSLSINLKADGPVSVEKQIDFFECVEDEGIEYCISQKGLSKERNVKVNGIAFEEDISDISGKLSTNNVKVKTWTNP